PMEDAPFAPHDALLQGVHDLATQVLQAHTAWREAVRVANFRLQSVLITREGEMLSEAGEVLAALQASIAQRRGQHAAPGVGQRLTTRRQHDALKGSRPRAGGAS